MDKKSPLWIQEGMRESVIQRFGICYDCLWKVLKRHMEEVEGMPDPPASPKAVFRKAFEIKLLPSSVEQWFQYIDARIGTTHDYSGEKAREAVTIVDDFINDAVRLFQTMTGKTWE